jgi:hypothetical protein
MWAQGPLIFEDALFVDDDGDVFGVVVDKALAASALVSPGVLGAVFATTTTDLAGAWLSAPRWLTAGDAPAELTPSPMPVPAVAAPIASTTSALHLRFFMGFSLSD